MVGNRVIFLTCVLQIIGSNLVHPEKRLRFGEYCEPGNWCDFGKWLWCGTENKCTCIQSKIYDSHRNRCVGLIGGECNAYVGDRDCPQDGQCQWENGEATCKCNPGFHATVDRTCSSAAYQPVENGLDYSGDYVTRRPPKKLLPPIHQYHQQRQGNVNYKYKAPCTIKSPKVNHGGWTTPTPEPTKPYIVIYSSPNDEKKGKDGLLQTLWSILIGKNQSGY